MSTIEPNGDRIVVALTPAVLDTLRFSQLSWTLDTVASLSAELDAASEVTPWLTGFVDTILAVRDGAVGSIPEGPTAIDNAVRATMAPVLSMAGMEAQLVREELLAIRDRLGTDAPEELAFVLEDLDALDALGWPEPRS